VSNKTGNNLSDKHLVDKVLDGDTRAFALIVSNTEGLVAQIVFKMIGNAEDRKDIAQDVYLKAFKNLRGFQFKAKLSTWIAQIAYHSCFNYLEKKRPDYPGSVMEEDGPDFESMDGINVETLIHSQERKAILTAAIEGLSPVYKTLITLYHQEEMSYEEIGLITGMPDGTVKSYLFRARKALKDRLLLKYKKEEL
jgi:RNA polymerase sigma factor (sigma-70 family)